jgi:hypothetical protein
MSYVYGIRYKSSIATLAAIGAARVASHTPRPSQRYSRPAITYWLR